MTLKNKIKEIPGLQFVVDSMELMSSAGMFRMLEQPFLTNVSEIDEEQQAVQIMREVLGSADKVSAVNYLRHQLMQLHDIRTTLHNLQSGILLSEVELFEIKHLSYLNGHARKALSQLELNSYFLLPDLEEVFSLLDPDGTGVPNFYVYDSYDPRLQALRQQMKRSDDSGMSDLLSQQNDVQQQVIERLCSHLRRYDEPLVESMKQMAYMDFTMARAVLAKQWNLCLPSKGSMELKGLFNPRLRQHNESVGMRYQPIDINLVQGVTFVTGANMAGKTVLLKSIGIAQLMYQFGFMIPAVRAVMKPVDDVVFCIGDEQNEMNGLSSFAAEITRISDVMRRSAQERLLILIDEPARTTNPVEGKALVQAIASIMQSRTSVTMITTHYSQLGVPCRRLRVRGFVESLVDVPLTAQNINRFIDYSLVPDDSDEAPQEALRIAEMINCDTMLVEQARKFLVSGKGCH